MEVKKEDGAVAAVAEKPEEVVVTLEHSSFGQYVFRAEEGKVASSISSALARAKKEASVKKEHAEIDRQQIELAEGIAACDQRIEAAKLLNDTARERSEVSQREALQKSVNALAKRREALVEALDK